MKKIKRIMIAKGLIFTVIFGIAGILPTLRAYAAAPEVIGNSVSSNSTIVEGVSDNEAPVITISENKGHSSRGRKVYDINTSDIISGIALIQAENTGAGVRSTLFQADDLYRGLNAEESAELIVTANGSYRVYAYDGKGNAAVQKLEVTGFGGFSTDKYRAIIEKNTSDNASYHKETSYNNTAPTYENTVIFGGNGDEEGSQGENKNTSYVYKSKNNLLPSAGTGIYDDWSMLKKKEDTRISRLWSEEGRDGEWIAGDRGSGDEPEYKTEISTLLNKRTSPFNTEASGIGDMIIESSEEARDTGRAAKALSGRKITAVIIITGLVSVSLAGIFLFNMKKGNIRIGRRN